MVSRRRVQLCELIIDGLDVIAVRRRSLAVFGHRPVAVYRPFPASCDCQRCLSALVLLRAAEAEAECLGDVWRTDRRFPIEISDRPSNAERAMITACRQRTLLGSTNKETVAVVRQPSASVEPATGRAGVAFDVGER